MHFCNFVNRRIKSKLIKSVCIASNCDPYKDEKLPDPPSELVHELSRRYIMLYEIMLGKPYEFTSAAESVNDSVLGYFRDK